MTKLRDDGYLETDDPVVAACFIGKETHSDHMLGHIGQQIMWLFELCAPAKSQVLGEDDCWYLYPILIPAKTVAEVATDEEGDESNAAVVIGLYQDPIDNLYLADWLRKHAK